MTLSVQKLSASLQSVCLCWTNRLCVASFGLVNGRNTCGLQKSYLLSCSPATIRSPFDSHTEKETVSPAFPPHPLASLLSLFLSFLFFVFFFTGQALELGRDTRLVVSMAWIMLVLLLDQAVYWCVWHSKWEIFSSLARLRAKSLHFYSLQEAESGSPQKNVTFSSLCSLSLRPFALNLLTLYLVQKQSTAQEGGRGRHPALFLAEQGPRHPNFRREQQLRGL